MEYNPIEIKAAVENFSTLGKADFYFNKNGFGLLSMEDKNFLFFKSLVGDTNEGGIIVRNEYLGLLIKSKYRTNVSQSNGETALGHLDAESYRFADTCIGTMNNLLPEWGIPSHNLKELFEDHRGDAILSVVGNNFELEDTDGNVIRKVVGYPTESKNNTMKFHLNEKRVGVIQDALCNWCCRRGYSSISIASSKLCDGSELLKFGCFTDTLIFIR